MQLRAGPPPRGVRFVRTVVSGSASLLITRRHLWGNAPRRNSPRQSRPFCRPQTPRPVFALWHARTSLNLDSLVVVRRPHLSAARLAIREVELFEAGILSRLLCISVGLPVQASSNLQRTIQSVTQPRSPGCQSLVTSSSRNARAPRTFRSSRCPSLPSHPFPVIGPGSR